MGRLELLWMAYWDEPDCYAEWNDYGEEWQEVQWSNEEALGEEDTPVVAGMHQERGASSHVGGHHNLQNTGHIGDSPPVVHWTQLSECDRRSTVTPSDARRC